VRRSILALASVSSEVMACEDHGVLIVRQYILHVFSERAGRAFYRLPGKFMQPLHPARSARNSALARNTERKGLNAGTQVSIHITAPERGIRLPDDRLQCVRHVPSLWLRHSTNDKLMLANEVESRLPTLAGLECARNSPHVVSVARMLPHSGGTEGQCRSSMPPNPFANRNA